MKTPYVIGRMDLENLVFNSEHNLEEGKHYRIFNAWPKG